MGSESPGTRIGRYKLLEEIGEGGFGVVFMAEQQEPVRRRVALKIIKAGMDTKQVVARFEAERQALAMMDHPNIARVFDAGATDTGRPYFVMELVKGIPITAYCDREKLSTDERLKLFIAVCSAVQHAHQKGIIHRDLKPTNVMVTMHDDKAVPKVIDFGVAKATQGRLTEKTLFTEFRQLIGTPAYMSPEQAQMIGVDIDTRSDIYSLGVLLYELLTGTTPFDSKELLKSGYDEMRRIIREVEPPTPSTRLNTLSVVKNAGSASLPRPGDEGTHDGPFDSVTVAGNRSADPKQLCHQLRGDLDWIVMKCLEKDRSRRYETAGSLADDIERHLSVQPVEARPPSWIYRVKKFVRRNKVGVLAGSAVAGALLVGLALATAGFVQARREARISASEAAKATAISDLLQSALQSANPVEHAKGAEYTVRQLLDDFAGDLAHQLVGQPEVEAQLRVTIGNAYRGLGAYDLAAPQLEAALALRRRIGGTESVEYAEVLVDYAQILAEQNRLEDGEHTAREAVRIYRRAGTTGRPLVKALWILQLQLAHKAIYVTPLAFEEELAVVEEALEVAKANGAEYPELANILHRHAPVLAQFGDLADAEECARRAVHMHRRMHGNHHPETAYGLADLGRVLRVCKKLREAELAFREAYEVFRRYYGDSFEPVGSVRDLLNEVIREQQDVGGTEVDHREPEVAFGNSAEPADVPSDRSVLSAQEALERELRGIIASLEEDSASSPDKSQRLMLAANYRQVAQIDLKQGEFDEAIATYQSAVLIASRLVAEEPENSTYAEERIRAQLGLGEALARAKRVDDSLATVAVALDLTAEASARFTDEDWVKSLAMDACTHISSVLETTEQRSAAQVSHYYHLLNRAIEQFDSVNLGSDIAKSRDLTRLYLRIGRRLSADSSWNAEAEDVRQRAVALWESFVTLEPKDPQTRNELSWTLANTVKGLQDGRAPKTDQILLEQLFLRAIALHTELAKESPNDLTHRAESGHLHKRLGGHLREQGRLDEARQHLRSALALFESPSKANMSFIDGMTYRDIHADTLSLLSQVLIAEDRAPEAVQACRAQVAFYEELKLEQPHEDITTSLSKAQLELARSLAAIGATGEAKQAMKRAAELVSRLLEEKPANSSEVDEWARMQLRLGDLYLATGILDSAIEATTAVLAEHARSPALLALRGEYFRRAGRFDKMAEDYSEAIRFDPKNWWYWHERGYAYVMLGKHQESVASHTRAIELNESDADQRARRGRSYEALGQLEAAEQDYAVAIQLNSNDWKNWWARRQYYVRQDQFEKAEADLAMAVRLVQSRPFEQNELAWMLVASSKRQPQDSQTAVELARKAIEQSPGEGTIWNTLGAAEYRAGNWNKSIAALEKSMELRSGGDAYDWFFLAMVHWQQGQQDEARTWYDKAVEWTEKNAPEDAELIRFRAEADALIRPIAPDEAGAERAPSTMYRETHSLGPLGGSDARHQRPGWECHVGIRLRFTLTPSHARGRSWIL